MTRNPREPLDLARPLSGHPAPHRDRGLGQPELGSQPGDEAALSAEEIHAGVVHEVDISTDDIGSPDENINAIHSELQHDESVDDIARHILQARKRAGWTQVELAKRLSVRQSAVSQWESGKAAPDLQKRIALAAVLSIPILALLPGAGSIPLNALDDPQVRQLIEYYLQLPASTRAAIVVLLRGLLEDTRSAPPQ